VRLFHQIDRMSTFRIPLKFFNSSCIIFGL
jgi:hypothetical protein